MQRRKSTPIEERLKAGLVPNYPSDCLLWIGSTRKGYGRIKVAGKHVQTHRLAYTIAKGVIAAGIQVCHSCDSPLCCNPNHLFLGTNTDNVADKVAKGRTTKGRSFPKERRKQLATQLALSWESGSLELVCRPSFV